MSSTPQIYGHCAAVVGVVHTVRSQLAAHRLPSVKCRNPIHSLFTDRDTIVSERTRRSGYSLWREMPSIDACFKIGWRKKRFLNWQLHHEDISTAIRSYRAHSCH